MAAVPPEQLTQWLPPDGAAAPTTDARGFAGVPGAERAAGITEWYTGPGVAVGIDRERAVVAYRRWAN